MSECLRFLLKLLLVVIICINPAAALWNPDEDKIVGSYLDTNIYYDENLGIYYISDNLLSSDLETIKAMTDFCIRKDVYNNAELLETIDYKGKRIYHYKLYGSFHIYSIHELLPGRNCRDGTCDTFETVTKMIDCLSQSTEAQSAPESTTSSSTASKVPAPSKEWSKTFGGTSHEMANSVQQTLDGGYIIAGDTYSYGTGGGDAWLIKTDCDGNQMWSKTFGGTNNDVAYSVQQTVDGGYIIAGDTYSYGTGGGDAWLIKTDCDGNQMWSKTFGGTGDDTARSVQQTLDGGYILAGQATSYGTIGFGFWLIKTDADGNQQWGKTFGETGLAVAYSVQQTIDGGYIVAGIASSRGTNNIDVGLIKTDANGNQQWRKTFGGTDTDYTHSVQQTSDGGYIVAGDTYSYANSDSGLGDAWLIKTDANGNQQWSKTFGGTYSDSAHSVQQTADGGFILAGQTQSYRKDRILDYWLIKTDVDGNQMWHKTFEGDNGGGAHSVQQTVDGGFITTGWTMDKVGNYDVWLIKVGSASEKSMPGFEAVFAIAGLLAVIYLLREEE